MSEKLVRFGVAMPEGLLSEFDEWMEQSGLSNRSLAIRHLVRNSLSHSKWQYGSGEVYGSITLLYDHHGNDVNSGLTSLQHDFGDVIICTTHVHISHELCMECIVVKGMVERLKNLEKALEGMNGIMAVNTAIASIISAS